MAGNGYQGMTNAVRGNRRRLTNTAATVTKVLVAIKTPANSRICSNVDVHKNRSAIPAIKTMAFTGMSALFLRPK